MKWSIAELDARWSSLPAAPRERGCVTQVCVRADVGQRKFPDVLELCPKRGGIGDRWERGTWIQLPDGSPDPRVQLAITSRHVLDFLQTLTGCLHHPGDTLIVDFDLSRNHLPAGARVRIGSALVEVSDVENDACGKFAAHYGVDVFNWIRAASNRDRRHRGLFARVVSGGRVRSGDPVIRCA